MFSLHRHHPLIPVDYQFIGQPVLVGGTMGTSSYILTGTQMGMQHTFGSTCHGAGRAASRKSGRVSRYSSKRAKPPTSARILFGFFYYLFIL